MKTHAKTAPSQQSIPAEWAPQAALWTAWPSHGDLWLDNLEPARAEIAQMIKAVSKGQKVKVLAMGNEAIAAAQAALGSAVEIVPAKFGDIWVRDTGPIFTAAGLALRFKTNGWGGKYDLEFDDTVGDELAHAAQANIIHHDFILEGGALEHNGEGVILTTRQCVLNENRNDWCEEEAEKALKSAFGANKILWLDEGLMNDHTDGHIDNLARFIGPNTVLTQHAAGPADPNADLFEKTIADLKVMGLEVKTIPSPSLVTNKDGDIVPASHMNFIITNEAVVVPTYGTDTAEEAVAAIAKLFPSRTVVGVSSISTLSGGGSFHCITQQEPQK